MASVTALNAPNNTRNFYPVEGQWVLKQIAVAASSAMVDGTAVCVEVSGSSPTGNVIKMPASATNTTGQNFVGILAEPIASTDADYATAGKLKGVWVPVNPGLSEAAFLVGSGTFTLADVGRTCALHTDSKSVAVDTNGVAFVITAYASSTKGRGVFAMPKVATA